MAAVDLTGFSDEGGFVFYLGGDHLAISTKSLSTILAGVDSLAVAINRIVDPEFQVDVELINVLPGSTLVHLRIKKALRKYAGVVLIAGATGSFGKDIVTGMISAYLYDAARTQENCTVRELPHGRVHIKGSNCDYILDRETHNLKSRVYSNRRVATSAKRLMKAVKKDSAITSIGVSQSLEQPPLFKITRDEFEHVIDVIGNHNHPPLPIEANADILATRQKIDDPQVRTVPTELTVISKSNSKHTYNFAWDGIRITARITDPSFQQRLNGLLSVPRRGARLRVDLVINQKYLRGPDVWINVTYEVAKVHEERLPSTWSTQLSVLG